MENIRLTDKGEDLLLRTYATVKVVGFLGGMILLMGIVGWLEGM
jgi:hypothetical protein